MRLLQSVLLVSSALLAGTTFQDDEPSVILSDLPQFRQDCDDMATVRAPDKDYWDRMAGVELTLAEACEIAVAEAHKKGYEQAKALRAELVLIGKPYYSVMVYTQHQKEAEDGGEPLTVHRRWEVRVGVTLRSVKMWRAHHRFPGKPTNGPDMVTLPSGVMVNDQQPGDGQFVREDSTVKVHYTMLLLDGTLVFDTYHEKKPRTFQLSEAMIPGLREGLLGARVGSKRKIVVPPDQAWGDRGLRDVVPPNATVVFDVEVRNVR